MVQWPDGPLSALRCATARHSRHSRHPPEIRKRLGGSIRHPTLFPCCPLRLAPAAAVLARGRNVLALSSDRSVLAAHVTTAPDYPNAALNIKPADLTCPGLAADGWFIGLYDRIGNAWQRQAVVPRGLNGPFALARDGNALFYGNALFTRSTGRSPWTCP